MTVRYLSTDKAPKPFSRYSQAVEVTAGSRLILVSGQVGVDAAGKLAETEEGQHEAAWRNVLAILAAEGLGPRDIAEINVYITSPGAVGLYRDVRDRMLAGAAPAATLLIVAGLADPRFAVEIGATAVARA
jgi:2-iminobutanoate/2-iminopropanoate deaminase